MSGPEAVTRADTALSNYQMIGNQLEQACHRVDRLTHLIQTVDNRLNGSFPRPSEESGKVAAEPNGYVEQLMSLMENLNRELCAAERAIEDLDNKVAT